MTHPRTPKPRLQGPFTFSDNTDYQNGWELATIADVLWFFGRKPRLLDDPEPGSIYTCGLVDAHGVACWPKRGPRGGVSLAVCDDSN